MASPRVRSVAAMIVTAALLGLLSACTRECNAMSCLTSLRVAFPNGIAVGVQLCVQGECVAVPAGSNGSSMVFTMEGVDSRGDLRTTLKRGTTVVTVAPKTLSVYPNGKRCPSECVQLSIKLDRSGVPLHT